MDFHPFEVTTPHVIYACLGTFVVLFGMFSLFLRERLYIGEACWAFLFGIIIGPNCANIFDPRSWGNGNEETSNTITLEFTRVVLAIGVFAIGVELPKAYMKKHWRSLLFLLGPIMAWGWFVSAGLIFALVPGLNFLSSLAVAACLTPTDPILAAAVVGGRWADKHVPAHLRHLLAAESGCNDGAAFPFLYIALYLILDAPDTGHAIRDWFLLLWLYQVVVGTLIGGLIGFGFRHLMKFCTRRDLIDRHSYVAQYVSLAILTIGVCTLLGSDDLLAAFACGAAFAWDGFFNRQTEEAVFSSVIDLLFNIAAFVYVGAWMPFDKFQDAALTLSVWRLIVIAILVLLLRRLPIMVALYRWIPDIKTFREAVFSGHFGPIGVGAIFISTLANEVIHKANKGNNHQIQLLEDTIQPIVAFMVLCSITIHGLSIPGLSLGRRVHSVSRTWSRRDIDGTPDWAHQARHINRGDDIVINRDSAMEQGAIQHGDKPPITEASRQASNSSSPLSEKPPISDGSGDTRVGEPDAPDYREEMPPDGEEIIAEWQEPHHLVIERRAGPGSDVEVEVTDISDLDPSKGPLSKTQHTELKAEVSKWKNIMHGMEPDTAKAGRVVKEVEEKIKELVSPSRNSSAIAEDDEAWASDGEGSSSKAPLAGPSQTPEQRKKSRVKEFGVHGRRRPNMRRNSSSSANPYAGPSSPTSSIPEEERGRDTTSAPKGRAARFPPAKSSSGKSSRPGTADSSLRHPRLDSVRGQHFSPTRESSPARSIRFVDEENPRSPPHIQTMFAGGNSSHRSLVDSPTEEQQPDSAVPRVTFDVPPVGGSGLTEGNGETKVERG